MTVHFGPNLAVLALVPLAGLRCLGAFAVAPLFGSRSVPAQVRVALGLLMGVLLVPLATSGGGSEVVGVSEPWLAMLEQPVLYGFRCLAELLFGMGIGYLALLFLAIWQIAGQMMDTEVGFAMVSVMDPQFGFRLPLLGSFFNVLGILAFLALEGHLLLLRALRDSVLLIPLGGVGLVGGAGDILIKAFSVTFVTALKFAAPVLAALFLTSVAVGMVARSVPQMNVFVVGLPLRVAVGLAIVAVSLPYAGTLLAPALSNIFDLIDRLLAVVAG